MLGVVRDGLYRRPWLALIAAIVVESLIFWFGQVDFVASDPLWYASIANGIAADPDTVFGNADTHPFVMRVGVTLPVALFYKLFGISPLTTNLYMLVCAIGVILIVYAAAESPRAKLIGLVLAAFCVPLLRSMTMLNVDLPAATLMAASVLCVARRDRGRGWLVGGAVALVAAFLVKETAIWCVFVWAYAIAVDVKTDGARAAAQRFAPAVIVGVVLVIIYLAICARVWGSPFARFRGIQDLTHEHAWSLHGKPASEWVSRLTWQPALFFAQQFQALLVAAFASPCLVRGKERIWLVATALFAALFWFGSSSLSAYTPLPLSGRMVLPVLPVLLVLATLACDRAIDRWRAAKWIVLALVIAVAAPAGRVMFGLVTRATPETDAFALLRREAADGRPLVIVCGEPRCVAIGGFYFGFAIPKNVTLQAAPDFAKAPPPDGGRVRALVNVYRAAGARTTGEDRTGPIENLKLPALLRWRHIRVYDAGDGRALHGALQPGSG